MTTITLPPDLEGALSEAARRQGTTPEQLALDSLRKTFVPAPPLGGETEGTLYDFLKDHIGTVDGPEEALSEDSGRRFREGLEEKQRRGKL